MTAVLPQTRARRAPAPAPRQRPADNRPPLRVVDRNYRSPAARRARARTLVMLLVVVVAVALFGLVASHVALTQGQFRLEKIRTKAGAEQDRYERLRLQVAELESPGRIVAAAQERLGMVPPATIKYLEPIGPAGMGSVSGSDPGGTATDDWSTVKRQLASRP